MKTMSNFMLCREIIFVKKTYIFFASGTIEELANGGEEVGNDYNRVQNRSHISTSI